jgi:hypothetical protein
MSETTTARTHNEDRPRRQWLGLGVLLLTLGAGYGVARLEPPVPAEVAEVEAEAEAEERAEARAAGRPPGAPRRPTVAEIMAEIETVAARHRVPPRLVAAIVAVESQFNPRAVSRRGAQGLMQLMPATAASVDVQDSFDARENIEGGVRHLRALMDRYQNDLPVVLAAYNAGDRAVLAYQGVPPFRETRQYVMRVLRRYDREAARAAARRIYGPRRPTPSTRRAAAAVQPALPAVQPAVPAVQATPPALTPRLVSYEGVIPAVVRYRYRGDLMAEHEATGDTDIAPRRTTDGDIGPRRPENP